MDNYFDCNLNKGEEVIIEIRHNKMVFVPIIIGMAAFAIYFLFILPLMFENVKTGWLDWLIFFIAELLLILPAIRIIKTKLALTNRRVIGKKGIFGTQSLDFPISKIDSIIVCSSFLGKIFHYNNIQIKSTNATRALKFKGISNANDFRNAIIEAIAQNEEDARKAQAEEIARAMIK